jgi:hypothetical protein
LLVDPTVGSERLRIFFARDLKFFLSRFGAFLLVSIAARRRPNNREHDNAEKRKKQNDAQPGGKWRAHVRGLANGFGVGHISSGN